MSQGIGITHLNCLVVKAGFYSDAAECWIFVRRVADSILGPGRIEDIFLHLLQWVLTSWILDAQSLLSNFPARSRFSGDKKKYWLDNDEKDKLTLVAKFQMAHVVLSLFNDPDSAVVF